MRTLYASLLFAALAVGCKPAPKEGSPLPPPDVSRKDMPPLAVLETFLGHLAEGRFGAAYELVAPSSKENGDPIAYNSPLDYVSFLRELPPPAVGTWRENRGDQSGDVRAKFQRYRLGKMRWETERRFRVWVTFQNGDRDEALLVLEGGTWYVADPIHIIR